MLPDFFERVGDFSLLNPGTQKKFFIAIFSFVKKIPPASPALDKK